MPGSGIRARRGLLLLACLMVRTGLLRRLGGLDTAMVPDRLAAADLGLRVRQTGYRVVYDPSVMLHRYAAADTIDLDNLQDQHKGQEIALFDKHSATLRMQHAASLGRFTVCPYGRPQPPTRPVH